MPILDFKEIPLAHVFQGYPDAFELFAREVLELIGYEIVESPSRGPDGGKDLILGEARKGVGGTTNIQWLVSCKHTAASKRAIGVADEPSILERVRGKNCQGFMGFYSTLPSSALASRLRDLAKEIEVHWFDREKIESQLLRSTNGVRLAERYFPKSMNIWRTEHPKPAKLGLEPDSLHCGFCGKDLLKNLLKEIQKKGAGRSVVTFWRAPSSRSTCIDDLHWACKGNCDFSLAATCQHKGWRYRGWGDLSDYCIPAHFLRTVMILANKLNRQEIAQLALDKFKTLLFAMFQFVARDVTTDEKERLDTLIKYFW